MISSLLKEFQEEAVFAPFLKDDFDLQSHVSSLVQGAVIAEQLGKLGSGIDRLEREIQGQVGSHYEDLLSQTTGVETLEDVLNAMHTRIQTLKAGVERLRARITEPYDQLARQIVLLQNLHATCELLRRIIRCLSYTHKLQEQLANGPKDIVKAASSLKELDETGKNVDLSGINILEKNLMFLRKARSDVEKQASLMMEKGVELQNQSQIGTALQVFYNLGMLSSSVDRALMNFVKNVNKEVLSALSINYLTEVSGDKRFSGPGKAVMPTIGQSAQFRANLWTGLEKVMEAIHTCCTKTFQLHKVLAKKRDPTTHICFLDEIYKANKIDLFTRMWKEVTEILSKEFTKSAKETASIRQALEVDYPKLLRMYGDLWRKVEDMSVDMKSTQGSILSSEAELDPKDDSYDQEVDTFDPESALRKSLIPLEKTFISRSLSRLFDPVNLMFSTPGSVPSKEDIDALMKTITSELNISAIDKSLSEAVAKSVVKAIQLFCQKCEQLLSSDEDASQVIGPPNSEQALNVDVINQLNYIHKQIERMATATLSHLSEPVLQLLQVLPSIDSLIVFGVDPLFGAILRSVQAIILTMHSEDFSRNETTKNEQCSLYMRELQKFLNRASVDYIQPFSQSSVIKEKVVDLCRFTLEYFVRHASLLRPIGEQGKLRLAADFAQIESVIEQFVPRLSELGSSYRLVRSFRPLLFQTPSHIASSSIIGDVIPYSTVLHFLFARATPEMRSPHQTAGWTQAKYSEWLDQHAGEADRLILVKGALEAYESYVKSKQLTEYDPLYPVMRELLLKGLRFVDPQGRCSPVENGRKE